MLIARTPRARANPIAYAIADAIRIRQAKATANGIRNVKRNRAMRKDDAHQPEAPKSKPAIFKTVPKPKETKPIMPQGCDANSQSWLSAFYEIGSECVEFKKRRRNV